MNFFLLALASLSIAGTANADQTPPNVERLASGVVVEHLVKGQGDQPNASDVVTVNYRGTLEDGTEFDSSYKRGEPATFPLQAVIPCWTEGVQTLQIGGKAKLTCPSDTAYGSQGIPGVIPPNATLTFDVELLGVEAR